MKLKLTFRKKLPVLNCPPATQDLELNTENRNKAIKEEHIQYGPLNLSDEAYWERLGEHWGTTSSVVKESRCGNCVAFDVSPRMLECLPGPVSEPIEDADGKLGYCWMHHFKCHSARTCYTWAGGGPISDDEKSTEWQKKSGMLEEKKRKPNPWAICTAQVGREDKDKYEDCVMGVKKQHNIEEEEKKDDRCTRIAKRKYDVWPSAYASGAVVQCRRGKIWKKLKEEELYEQWEQVDEIVISEQEFDPNLLEEGGFGLEKKYGLHGWFKRNKGKGWIDCKTGKPCGRQKGEKRKGYPACRPTKAQCDTAGKTPLKKKKGKKEVSWNEEKELEELIYETDIMPHLHEAFLDDGTPVCVACLHEQLDEASCDCPNLVYEAEYRGRKVKLNKPTRGDVKKFKVYVKDPKTGNVRKVNFGHGGTSAKKKGEKTMRIRKSNPKARKSFRARHNCKNPGPKTKARYWSCKAW